MKNNDLISRSALLTRLHISLGKAVVDWVYGQRYDYFYKAIDIVQQMPAVAPESLPEFGEWEHLGGDEWSCTQCGHVTSTEGSWKKPWYLYCPNCGARMRGDNSE